MRHLAEATGAQCLAISADIGAPYRPILLRWMWTRRFSGKVRNRLIRQPSTIETGLDE